MRNGGMMNRGKGRIGGHRIKLRAGRGRTAVRPYKKGYEIYI